MRTLSLFLCSLMLLGPAMGQQAPRRNQPNFYVPYGVRDFPVDAMELESSSAEGRVGDPGQLPNAPPMRRPYPIRRRHRRSGPGYGASAHLSAPATGIVIGALFAVGLAFVAIAAGDN